MAGIVLIRAAKPMAGGARASPPFIELRGQDMAENVYLHVISFQSPRQSLIQVAARIMHQFSTAEPRSSALTVLCFLGHLVTRTDAESRLGVSMEWA